MATTLSALQTGHAHFDFVLAIDGYGNLISNASQSAVQTAWASTDWATRTVIPGLIVDLDNHQQLDPWNPFKGGGTCTIKVQCGSSTATDTFAIDMNRTDAGAETVLDETATRTSTLFVGFTGGFPLIGEAHCGTECFAYGFISGHGMNPELGRVAGSNRGKYVAFGVKNSVATYGAVRFSEHHRVAVQNNGVRFAPIVSEQPRTWTGRRVSVWMHTKDPTTGALNAKSDALCVFVGELSEPRDDDDKGKWTTVLLEHLLDRIPKTTLLRDQWSATVDYGVQLAAGQRFRFGDHNNTTLKTANDLVVVASGASGTNQVDEGAYGHEEIAAILNRWWGGESAAGRINGTYTINIPEDVDGSPRSVIRSFVPGSSSTPTYFAIQWPQHGWGTPLGYPGPTYQPPISKCGSQIRHVSPKDVKPFGFAGADIISKTLRINLEAQVGIFVGQNATLPAEAKSLLGAFLDSKQWGLFLLECETPMVLLATVGGNQLRQINVLTNGSWTGKIGGKEELLAAKIPIGSGPPRLRQIFVHEGKMATVMKWLFYSTGENGYNHPEFDILPHGQGLGIPYDILGENFEITCDTMPGANDVITLVLEKPRTLSDAIRADLVVRNAHLVFRKGGFRWTSWTSPSSAIATVVLDQNNKAETVDASISSRSTAVLDRSWVRNYIKINYNRDIAKAIGSGEDSFLATPLIYEDATSIDDMGGVPSPVTLDLRNVYNDTDQVGQGVRGLAAGFISWLTLWSRPLWRARRSIAPTLFEGFGVGDVAALDDPDLRDPSTGLRSVSQLPVLIVGRHYKIQTAPAPEKMRFTGECDVVRLGSDRIFAYSPAAEIDETANTGGFTAGYNGVRTFKFKAHEHSHSTQTVDVGRFAVNDVVDIIAIDPDDPATVDSWRRTITNVSAASNEATVDTAPSSPSFDTAKRYRMVYAPFSAVQSSQHLGSFQAGSNKTITQTSPPDQYGAYSFSIDNLAVRPSSFDHTITPELLADKAYGPNLGTARDCGYDQELSFLVDHLMDHGTRRSSPAFDSVASTNTEDCWKLLRVETIFLGDLIYGNGVNRYLWLAPHWCSSNLTPAQTVHLRVWISGFLPVGSGTRNFDNQTPGYTIKAPAAGNTWSVWSADQTNRNAAPQAYPLGNFNGHQHVFIIIEGTLGASVRGLYYVNEGERFEI